MPSHSQVEISATALCHNIEFFRALVPPGMQVIAVVKANAYGHGLAEVATTIEHHVDAFQVDDLYELRALRQITGKKAYVLGYVAPDEIASAVRLDGICAVLGLTHLQSFEDYVAGTQETVRVALAVDLEFGREGVLVVQAPDALARITDNPLLALDSLYGHFSSADLPQSPHTDSQLSQLLKLLNTPDIRREIEAGSLQVHLANTPGILSSPAALRHTNAVRLGLGIYGLWPSPELATKWHSLSPVLRWTTRVAELKTLPTDYPVGYGATFRTEAPTTIALIPQGYSDGLPRLLSGRGSVIIRGRRCPLVGRISMNMCVADVTHLPDVKLEDEVVLLGSQGNEEITATEIAHHAETIHYEILARITPQLRRKIISPPP